MEKRLTSDILALDALRELYPDSSRRTLQGWLRAGRFFIDDLPLKRENTQLLAGQTLRSQETFRPPISSEIKILYADRYLIVIDKPSGLLSVPLDEGKSKRHALGLLRQTFETNQIFAVHRIDRETSGVLLFARGKESEERLKEMFENHDLRREYFAVVEGRMKEDSGTWQSELWELPSFHVVVSSEGKTAITHYSVLRRSAKYTYLKLRLETGRKHQIRVHAQIAGHPVLGDQRYGAVDNPIKRLCLHASELEFQHPFTKKTHLFSSPLPKAFVKISPSV